MIRFKSILVQLLITFAPILVAAELRCADVLDKSLTSFDSPADIAYQMSRRQLDELGVEYELAPEGRQIRILPSHLTELGRLAYRLRLSYSANLEIDPTSLVKSRYRGQVDISRFSEVAGQEALFLGLDTLYEPQRLLRDLVILHEMRHLKTQHQLTLQKNSQFYGEVEAIGDRLPGFIREPNSQYGQAYYYDEIQAHYSSLRLSLLKLKKISSKGYESDLATEINQSLYFSNILLDLAQSASTTTNHIIRKINKEPGEIEFVTENKITYAELEVIKGHEFPFIARIPIVGVDAEAASQSQSLGLLREQVTQTNKVSQRVFSNVFKALSVLKDISDMSKEFDREAIHTTAIKSLKLVPLVGH